MQHCIYVIEEKCLHLSTNYFHFLFCILFTQPSGVGKTRLIQALAGESQMNFMCVDTTSILSKWQGESTKNVKMLFQVARELSPCIMFLGTFSLPL